MVLFDHGLRSLWQASKVSKVPRGPPSGPRHNPLVGEPRAYGAKAYAGYNHFPTRPRGNRGRRRKLDVLASHSGSAREENLATLSKAKWLVVRAIHNTLPLPKGELLRS